MWDGCVVVAESIADPETFSVGNVRSLIQQRWFDVRSLSLFLSLTFCLSLSRSLAFYIPTSDKQRQLDGGPYARSSNNPGIRDVK